MTSTRDVDCIPSTTHEESPKYVRTSLAAAMTLGKIQGRFYRDAKLYCINLLLTYNEGCHARCAYCGLSHSRDTGGGPWTDNSFIRVEWPIYSVAEIKEAIMSGVCPHVERVCVSMITNARAREDCIRVVSEFRGVLPGISALITPTLIDIEWLRRLKAAGADKVGIAIDAATPELFDELRGRGVRGPHKWSKYWKTVEEAINVFGRFNVGVHLIVGVGETEKQMIHAIQRAYDLGAKTHLFSFFPEQGSIMENTPQPPLGTYRRVQMARYIINEGLGRAESMKFNEHGQLISFGISQELFEKIISDGHAFMTSGCPGITMDNVCNRPFGNCTPYQAAIGHWRNYPIFPTEEDVRRIRTQLDDYSFVYRIDDEVEADFE